jgi:hypothetical protein
MESHPPPAAAAQAPTMKAAQVSASVPVTRQVAPPLYVHHNPSSTWLHCVLCSWTTSRPTCGWACGCWSAWGCSRPTSLCLRTVRNPPCAPRYKCIRRSDCSFVYCSVVGCCGRPTAAAASSMHLLLSLLMLLLPPCCRPARVQAHTQSLRGARATTLWCCVAPCWPRLAVVCVCRRRRVRLHRQWYRCRCDAVGHHHAGPERGGRRHVGGRVPSPTNISNCAQDAPRDRDPGWGAGVGREPACFSACPCPHSLRPSCVARNRVCWASPAAPALPRSR